MEDALQQLKQEIHRLRDMSDKQLLMGAAAWILRYVYKVATDESKLPPKLDALATVLIERYSGKVIDWI